MFGDPETNPKGWPLASVGDLCVRVTDGTHQSPRFVSQGIPFVFISNLIGGKLDLNTSKFVSLETYEELTRRCRVERDDILYTTVGSYGIPVKVDTDVPFTFQRHVAHLKPDHGKVAADFLVGLLRSPSLQAQAHRSARGVAQKTVNLSEIRKFRAVVPPLKAQQEFATKVRAIDGLRGQLERSGKAAVDLSAALISQYLAAPS